MPFCWHPEHARHFFRSSTPETEWEVLVSAQERRQNVGKLWYQALEVPAGGWGAERRHWVAAARSAGSIPRTRGCQPRYRHGVAWARPVSQDTGGGRILKQGRGKTNHPTPLPLPTPLPVPRAAGRRWHQQNPAADGSEHKLHPSVLTPLRDRSPRSAGAPRGTIPEVLPACFALMQFYPLWNSGLPWGHRHCSHMHPSPSLSPVAWKGR